MTRTLAGTFYKSRILAQRLGYGLTLIGAVLVKAV